MPHDLHLQDIRSYHVGGQLRTLQGIAVQEQVRVPGQPPVRIDMNGDYMVGQLYVQHFRVAKPRGWPVILMHGGSLTGACWETTPNGEAGWLTRLLQAGHDVLLVDAFERGRAGWPHVPSVLPTPAQHRSLDAIWHEFRFGLQGSYQHFGHKTAFEGLQFPIEHLDRFAMQIVPRWTGTEAFALAAYQALIEQTGPCILLGHSQGGYFALECALNNPDLVKAAISLEPPTVPQGDWAPLPYRSPAPLLAVWGDYLPNSATWSGYFQRYQTFARNWQAALQIDTLQLPQMGIHGNSHMLMMERNSAQVFALVHDWLLQALPEQAAAARRCA